ncbi:MAG: DUF2818 family protein [Neisseria sp.]|nr:DUF2818 family protein [Neisseria sp.]
MTASMYILIVLALIFANAPFATGKLFGLKKLAAKHIGHHLLEIAVGFLLTLGLAYLLESRAGQVHTQGWAFYVTVACLYLVAAFPGFVVRYFWTARNKE